MLRHALERGAIHESYPDLAQAIAGADLIYVALPVGHTIEMLPEIARLASAECAGDRCVQHQAVGLRGRGGIFSRRRRAFPGRPSDGGKRNFWHRRGGCKFVSDSKYALIRPPSERKQVQRPSTRAFEEFVALIKELGAEPIWLEAEVHDRAAAVVSHLPQLLSVALAGVVRSQTDETGLPITLAGRGLRDACASREARTRCGVILF